MESIILGIIILVFFMSLGVPIAFSLAAAGMVGIYLETGDLNTVTIILGTTPFSCVANYTLTTLPMFIVMALFSASGGLAQDLYDAAASWLSHVQGGLAIATVFACGIFGAMSGTSMAAASVMSTVAMPSMRRLGYSDALATGAIGVGATVDILIPPSISMVLYGMLTGQSIGRLLIAGIIPGIILAFLLSSIIYVWVTLSPKSAPTTHRSSWRTRWRSMVRTWPSISLILMVIGFLYSGVATPTEVGAMGAFLAALIGFATRRLTWASAAEAIKKTISITAMIIACFIGATIFGYFITLTQVPQQLIAAVGAMHLNRWIVIIGICVFYFIISMFMDEVPLMLITLQVAFPLILALGFDPIWFGVLMILLICMGLVFPPVGVIAFIVSATTNVNLMTVYKGTSILTIALFLTAALIMVFPELALWLPRTMK